MRFLIGLVAVAGLATPALAGEVYNWDGFYLGAHAGYAWGDATTRDDPADWGTDPKFIGPFNFDLDGGFGGGTIGYNLQAGSFVFGPEFDVGYMDLSGSRKTDSSNPTKFQTLNVDSGFYALLGGRAGFAFGNTYIYGKGGWLYYDTDVTQTTTNPGYKTNGSGALDGWAYGAGLEQALGHGWSLKGEFLHFDFNQASGDQTSISDDPIGHVYENVTDLSGNSVKLGVNYKLGGERYAVPLK